MYSPNPIRKKQVADQNFIRHKTHKDRYVKFKDDKYLAEIGVIGACVFDNKNALLFIQERKIEASYEIIHVSKVLKKRNPNGTIIRQ